MVADVFAMSIGGLLKEEEALVLAFRDAARGMFLCLDDRCANILGSPASEWACHFGSESLLRSVVTYA